MSKTQKMKKTQEVQKTQEVSKSQEILSNIHQENGLGKETLKKASRIIVSFEHQISIKKK